MESYIVRKAIDQDVPALADVAAKAFENDPLLLWLGDSPENRLEIGQVMFRSDWRMNHMFDLIYCEDACRGFAVWMPPGATHSFRENLQMVWDMGKAVHGTRRAWNQWKFFRTIDGLHPKIPHYYLSFLGVTPGMQGKGVGPALIQPVLERCDLEKMPAYLETETEKNVRFYEKRGFIVQRTVDSVDGEVRVWMMWREPITG